MSELRMKQLGVEHDKATTLHQLMRDAMFKYFKSIEEGAESKEDGTIYVDLVAEYARTLAKREIMQHELNIIYQRESVEKKKQREQKLEDDIRKICETITHCEANIKQAQLDAYKSKKALYAETNEHEIPDLIKNAEMIDEALIYQKEELRKATKKLNDLKTY